MIMTNAQEKMLVWWETKMEGTSKFDVTLGIQGSESKKIRQGILYISGGHSFSSSTTISSSLTGGLFPPFGQDLSFSIHAKLYRPIEL